MRKLSLILSLVAMVAITTLPATAQLTDDSVGPVCDQATIDKCCNPEKVEEPKPAPKTKAPATPEASKPKVEKSADPPCPAPVINVNCAGCSGDENVTDNADAASQAEARAKGGNAGSSAKARNGDVTVGVNVLPGQERPDAPASQEPEGSRCDAECCSEDCESFPYDVPSDQGGGHRVRFEGSAGDKETILLSYAGSRAGLNEVTEAIGGKEGIPPANTGNSELSKLMPVLLALALILAVAAIVYAVIQRRRTKATQEPESDPEPAPWPTPEPEPEA